MTGALDSVAAWPAMATAGVALRATGLAETVGPSERAFAWASVTKVLTALAVWIAVEEGTTAWNEPAGPPGATLSHLLAHASGLAPDSDAILAPPGVRRIYSNRGVDVAADHVATRAGMTFSDYLATGVIDPLGLAGTRLAGSPAAGASGPLVDLIRLGRELLAPTLVSEVTVAQATAVAFPGLSGVLPGFGRQNPNDWGLGVEIRDEKHPHWTGRRNSPRTFGHFGQSGVFLWIDPVAGLVVGSLSDRSFGPWAVRAWPALSDDVIAAYAGA
jgi:CubicO group peptidase (beta-lactamase class C family)